MNANTTSFASAARRLAIATFILAIVGPMSAQAQFGSEGQPFDSRQIIERNSDEILNSPEFQHFRRTSRRGPVRPQGRGGEGGAGNEQNGNERGGDNAGRGDRRGDGGDGRFDPNENRNRDRNNVNRDRGDDEPQRGNRDFQSSSAPRSSFGSFGSGASALFQGLGWIVLAVMAGLVIYMIVKAIADRERPLQSEIEPGGSIQIGEIEPDHPPGEHSADVYLSRARQLARDGKYREAVAQLMLGAMSFVERSGLIRYRKGLTQRDYLRAVRRRQPAGESYKQMLRIYEPLGFGRRDAQRQHFDASLESYQAGFHGREPVSQD